MYCVLCLHIAVGVNLDCWYWSQWEAKTVEVKTSSTNQRNTEEIREKDRERKREKRAILRGEEVANQPMMGESNDIANNIGII